MGNRAMTTHQSCLTIKGLQFSVLLGWPDTERQQPQQVLADIILQSETPPSGCQTDQIEDTFCYAELIQKLQYFIAGREFRLLEYLSAEIYKYIQTLVPLSTKIRVSITKSPPLEGLTQGVVFDYGDTL